MRATLVAVLLSSLAFAAPAAAADEPICHGQLAPRTPAQEEQFLIELAMEGRAENGLRADEAYVRELERRGLPESVWISGPVTPAEERYLRLRYLLGDGPGPAAQRYLDRHRDLYGGGAIVDRFPRKPLLLLYLTRNRAKHAARLKRLVTYPKLLRTAGSVYSQRTLQRIGNRINDTDYDKLRDAGFDVTYAHVTPPDRVVVPLVTPRTDYAEYFTRHYGPQVTVELKGTELTELVCVEAGYFQVVGDGRTLIVHWIPQDSYAKRERIEVTEFDDRVELGVVERQPTANDTDGAGPDHFKLRVTLSRPLGDRAVIDAGDRMPLHQSGAAPGAPPCPPDGLDEAIAIREVLGLPTGRKRVLRLFRRNPGNLTPYTRAESRWVDLVDAYTLDPRVSGYIRRHPREYSDHDMVGRFPHTPHLVVWFTDHIKRHQRNLGPSVEVRRAALSSDQLLKVFDRIYDAADAAGDIIDGYGDTAFYFRDIWTRNAHLLVWVRTQRTDAARYFREHFGPSVRVVVESRRWECGEARY